MTDTEWLIAALVVFYLMQTPPSGPTAKLSAGNGLLMGGPVVILNGGH